MNAILKKRIRLNHKYCELESWEECGWWSNERSSISLLAAAAWDAGGIALEEYSTPKERKKKQRTGRCDLYINTGKVRFACEAKQIFPRLRKGNLHDTSEVEKRFKQSCDDARDLSPNEGRRLGICFVTPRFPSTRSLSDVHLKDYLINLQKLKTGLACVAIAWCFPKKARSMKWKPNNKIYPGVIVLIREVRRKT